MTRCCGKSIIGSKIRPKRTGQRGALLFEVALTFPVFLILTLTGTSGLVLMSKSTNLENAVSRAARWASLGTAWQSGITQASDPSGVESLRRKIESLSGLPVDAASFEVCPSNGVSTACTSNSRGTPGQSDWIYIKARVPLRVGPFTVVISRAEFVRNEPNFQLKAEANFQTLDTTFTIGSESRAIKTF